MEGPVVWEDDGTPRSARFNDIYRSRGADGQGGLAQSRHVFLAGCGLWGPKPLWHDAPEWTVLETGFGLGLNFLATWKAWRDDAHRPRRLHYVALELDPVRAADLLLSVQAWPELQPLAKQLHKAWWGLVPGLHTLSLDHDQVRLTLAIGDATRVLKELRLQAHSVYLDGFDPERNPDMWASDTLLAVSRCCQPGARLASWCVARTVKDALARLGFEVHKVKGLPPKRHALSARYQPHWLLAPVPHLDVPMRRCAVLGAGLAGAATARALAERGWQVTLMDRATHVAAGASGLPVGLIAPHTSPDDALLSQLSRAGVRLALARARDLLQAGEDWALTGVEEHRLPGKTRQGGMPADAAEWRADWTREMPSQGDHRIFQHLQAAWIKPAQLVKALIAHPLIAWVPNQNIARLALLDDGDWELFNADEQSVGLFPQIVVAMGPATAQLLQNSRLPHELPLQAIRGQLSWGLCPELCPPHWPARPVNGHGSFIAPVPTAHGPGWFAGSTFDRQNDQPSLRPQDHHENRERLRALLPALDADLDPAWEGRLPLHGWSGVRCTVPDRLPLVGPLDAEHWPGLNLMTAMGARGLTLGLLCAELLASQLHGDPAPVTRRHAKALAAHRFSTFIPSSYKSRTKK